VTALFETAYDEARRGIEGLAKTPAVIGRGELERAREAADEPAGAPRGGARRTPVSASG